MSAFGGKADIGLRCTCPLMTQSGHRPPSTYAILNRYIAILTFGRGNETGEFISLLGGACGPHDRRSGSVEWEEGKLCVSQLR